MDDRHIADAPESASEMGDLIHELKHYLPAQAPLKDFIHHNTLHAFQHLDFFKAIQHASEIFGYNISLPLSRYRSLFDNEKISEDILERIIITRKGEDHFKEWKHNVLYKEYRNTTLPRIGMLRSGWKKIYRIDLDPLVHGTLFRIVCSYLDQGISIWNFPAGNKGFLSSIRALERNSFASFFRTERARKLLLDGKDHLKDLLQMVVGDATLYKQYLFDQQFAHQGWSGIVSAIEDNPQTLMDTKKISLHDFIVLELLLEIDTLDYQLGKKWKPLSFMLPERPQELFTPLKDSEFHDVLAIWQEAYEWSYYDQVLAGLIHPGKVTEKKINEVSFQAMFCLDDREGSFRRYLEKFDRFCETYGTPGFFNVEFFFKPEHGKFYSKLCPAPVTPKHLIKEVGSRRKKDSRDPHFTKHTHTLFGGWLISQTLGFWSAFRLFLNIFKPGVTSATTISFNHMDKVSKLTIENKHDLHEHGLQVGFTFIEMADRVENLLKSIGLIEYFAPIIYVIGHGSSSVNNPHYAAYDCGACSGRPGSVNARVVSYMANQPEVRKILSSRGIDIPSSTQFLGGLHDTCRDEITFYDEEHLSSANIKHHHRNQEAFNKALELNAKERSRRFESINTRASASRIHEQVKRRSVSLFEPRPELNHATNAICIVGSRSLTRKLFLDRRAFMNSYDYKIDPDGKYLLNILQAAAPVCGGINLEYFFSRVDNQKLGAGSKLPHNVMGLFGVANGIEGDLRPGLPKQMIEIHDPVRLMLIVEHFPEVILKTIRQHAETNEWFKNNWIHLVAINPESRSLYLFRDEAFTQFYPLQIKIESISQMTPVVEAMDENIPVYLIPDR